MSKGRRALTRMEQFIDTRNHFRGVTLTRTGIALAIRPSPESPTYQIRIDYIREASPKVYVVSPKLEGKPPHLYKGGYLCLYWREYDNTLGFSETIVPWTAMWLYTYEIWQVSGNWVAPESDHAGPK